MSTQEGVDVPVSPEPMDDLLHAATDLNLSTRQLNEGIEALEDSLKRLNLGVPVWIHTSSTDKPDGQVNESEWLGYVKHKGTWGICLRLDLEGLAPDPDEIDETVWPFCDGPRDMRIRGAEFLERLVDEIKHDAKRAAEKVATQAVKAVSLAATINAIAEKSRPKANLRPKAGR